MEKYTIFRIAHYCHGALKKICFDIVTYFHFSTSYIPLWSNILNKKTNSFQYQGSLFMGDSKLGLCRLKVMWVAIAKAWQLFFMSSLCLLNAVFIKLLFE